MINQLETKTFIIFGAGSLAKKVINECEKNNFQIAYILDNDNKRHNTLFQGYTIKSPQSIKLKENEVILISSSYGIEIQKQLRELSLKAGEDFINYNLLFPYCSNQMKYSARFDELNDIGQLLGYSIDDVGVLLRNGDSMYRAIYNYKEQEIRGILDTLKKNNFYDGKIINAEISDKGTKNFQMILKHPFISYCSDSRSWSFSMIKDGFYSIISLLKELHKDNLTLKDAHGMNLTYYQGKFQWIDFGSIVKGDLGQDTIKELLEWFLFPLILMANGQSRAFYEHNHFGGIKYFMIKTFLDEKERKLLDQLFGEEKINESMYLFLEKIQSWSDCYFTSKIMNEKTTWGDYQKNDLEGQLIEPDGWSLKEKTVFEFIKKCNGKSLIDIAGNNGWYCGVASKYLNISGVLVDYDYKCIENAYQQFKKDNSRFIPLVNDFNGFPENLFYVKQNIKFDVVLCLAFIHHLVFSNGFTFEKVRDTLYEVSDNYLIIEFVKPNDEHVSLWMNTYFSWYTKQNFEKVFSEKYSIVSVASVSESREVYLMKKA